jgi:hypothetical protein
MKTALIAFSLSLASQVFATETGAILKEVWTCTNNSKEATVSALKVTIDHKNNTVVGSLKDGSMTSEDIALTGGVSNLEGGVYPGHDTREYSVKLIQNRSDDWEYGSETELRGQALVEFGGFIDCLGDINGADVLTCKVKLERSK